MAKKRATTRVSGRQRWAFHQAGHAVVAQVLQREFESLGLPCSEGRGSMRHPPFALVPAGDSRRGVERRARNFREDEWAIYLGGVVAAGIHVGRRNPRGADVDLVRRLAASYCGSGEELAAYVKWLLLRTENRLQQAPLWAMVERLAGELLRRGSLSYREACWTMEAPSKSPGAESRT